MSTAWIKMRSCLQTHPKVAAIAQSLRVPVYAAVGALHAVWSAADQHSIDGRLRMTGQMLDAVVGIRGVAGAMVSVGWLIEEGDTLTLPEFDTHQSHSAKRRALESVRKMSARAADSAGTAPGLGAGRAAHLEKEKEKEKEEEREQDSAEGGQTGGEPNGFIRFWNAWPKHFRKVDRKTCLKRWLANGLEKLADQIVAAVEKSKTSREWQKDQGQYIPQPATWLNKRSWEPFASAPTTAQGSAPASARPAAPASPWALFDRLPPLAQPGIIERVRGKLAAGGRVEKAAADFDDAARRTSPHWTDALEAELRAEVPV